MENVIDFGKYQRIALVESGGAAKGAYQVGVGEVLAEHGCTPSIWTGVSVGALNAVAGAQAGLAERGKVFWYELLDGGRRRWVRREDVYQSFPWYKAAFRLWRSGGAMSNTPLRRWMESVLDLDALREATLEVGAVNLTTTRYHGISPSEAEDFITMLLASTNVPSVVPPERFGGELWADGGIRNITPIGDALRHGPDLLVIILTRSLRNDFPPRPIRPIVGSRGLGIIKRTIDILTEEVFNEDVRTFIRLNEAARQFEEATGRSLVVDGKRLEHVPFVLIQPTASLGEGMDFSQEVMEYRYQLGRQDAATTLQRRAAA